MNQGIGVGGLCSLCCVLCPLLMASRCGAISQVWLWKTFPRINPIRSEPCVRGAAWPPPPERCADSVDSNNQICRQQVEWDAALLMAKDVLSLSKPMSLGFRIWVVWVCPGLTSWKAIGFDSPVFAVGGLLYAGVPRRSLEQSRDSRGRLRVRI